MNLANCAKLERSALTGTWFRAVRPQYFPSVLESFRTAGIASRFSPASSANPAFQLLYLAENHSVAMFEVGALIGPAAEPVSTPRSITVVAVTVKVSNIVDLTNASESTLLATTAQELTGDWRGYSKREGSSAHAGQAPSQKLGRALFDTKGIGGFVSFSAKLPEARILGIFPEKLASKDLLRYSYTDTRGETHIVKIP